MYKNVMKLLQGETIDNKIYIKIDNDERLMKKTLEFLEQKTDVIWSTGAKPSSYSFPVEYLVIRRFEPIPEYGNLLTHNNTREGDADFFYPWEVIGQMWMYREVD